MSMDDATTSQVDNKAMIMLHDALCKIRYLTRQDMNDQGRKLALDIADAAHNIPMAFVPNNANMQYYLDGFTADMQRLEILVDPEHFSPNRYHIDESHPPSRKLASLCMVCVSIGLVAGVIVGKLI